MRPTKKPLLFLIQTSILALTFSVPLSGFTSEEEDLKKIAKYLKPISDSQWNEIASSKISDTYEVQKGDNLWNISKSLFGNAFYWPKVWTFNNDHIKNPHIIEPSQKLVFVAGSSDGIPTLAKADDNSPRSSAAGEVTEASVKEDEKKHKYEYEKLSPEMWAPEDFDSALSSEYDDVGIEKGLRIDFAKRLNFRVPALVNENTLPYLGEIVGSRRDGSNLSEGEVVFIKSNGQDLQVGAAYSILSDPLEISDKRTDRIGFGYTGIGEIRILTVKDGTYVAEITKGSDVVKRGHKIYPLLPLISEVSPKAAKAPLESLVLVDPNTSLYNVSQFKFVYFDRGLEDGVEVGNIFRVYDYYDPITRKKITDSDFLISADAMIVHATAQFSTALIIRAKGTISNGDFGVLQTNISDYEKKRKTLTKSIDGPEVKEDPELDELDSLDRNVGEGMGRKEEVEIKELDEWDRTKDVEPTIPSDTPADDDIDALESNEAAPAPDAAAPSTESMEPLPPLDGDVSSTGEPPSAQTPDPLDSADIPVEPMEE